MELLLNLMWLLLALPAYWLWRGRISASAGRRFSSLQCLLALACCLIVLFPVISATDDLRAMRAEMEESVPSKRIGQRSGDKPSISRYQSQPSVPVLASVFSPQTEAPFVLPAFAMPIVAGASISATGRAPPATSLA